MSAPKNHPIKVRRIARETLERLNGLPEVEARRVVKFLALVYLRPKECREIEQILKELDLLLWHEHRLNVNRNGKVAKALLANCNESRERLLKLFASARGRDA